MRKRLFLVSKIVLTAISLVGIIVFKSNIDWSNLLNNIVDVTLVREIAYDISIGVFSAMILVWFIDEIGNHIKEQQSRKKEITQIKRFNKVLQRYIEQYTTMFYCVSTPLSNRKFDEVTMSDSFTLKDMRDLHHTSLLVKEGITNSAVDSFLDVELGLRNEFASLVQKFDFDFYPQFADIFLEYIQASIKNDCRAGVTANTNLMRTNKDYFKEIHDLLESKGEEYYTKALSEEGMPATIIHPYMYLYEMMKLQRKLILQYQTEIKKIECLNESEGIKQWFRKVWNRIRKEVTRVNKTKVKLFFARCGKWIYTILIVALMSVAVFLCNKYGVVEKVSKWSGETIAVVGTLLGALIGGIFTLIGSVYVNRNQLKAQTHIKRKNLIYKPLYDELCAIENDILSDNPFPSIIVFKTHDFGNLKYPQYTVWDRIKADTRYLETPKTLVSEMEQLYSRIQEYLKTRGGNNEEITELTNGIFQEIIGTQCTIQNLGDCVIKYALEESQQDVCEYGKIGLKDSVEITDEQRNIINKMFYERCKDNASIQRIKKAKQEWTVQQKKVIDLLTDLIQYVNLKYEG